MTSPNPAAPRAADGAAGGAPFRVLVTGSRTWTRHQVIWTVLAALHARYGARLVIVHGACPRGADAIADSWCRRNRVPVERYPADWSTGRDAGHRRNAAMVATGPDGCLAFIRDQSPGATGCACLAEQAGIRTVRHTPADAGAPPVPVSTGPDPPPGLDWCNTGGVGPLRPCRICRRPAFIRDPEGRPCHKVCAERFEWQRWQDTESRHARRPTRPAA